MYVGIHGVPAGWIDPGNLSSPLLVQPQKIKIFLATLVAIHFTRVSHSQLRGLRACFEAIQGNIVRAAIGKIRFFWFQ